MLSVFQLGRFVNPFIIKSLVHEQSVVFAFYAGAQNARLTISINERWAADQIPIEPAILGIWRTELPSLIPIPVESAVNEWRKALEPIKLTSQTLVLKGSVCQSWVVDCSKNWSNKWRYSQNTSADQTPIPCVPGIKTKREGALRADRLPLKYYLSQPFAGCENNSNKWYISTLATSKASY